MRKRQTTILFLFFLTVGCQRSDPASLWDAPSGESLQGILGPLVTTNELQKYPELSDVLLMHSNDSNDNCGLILIGPSLALTNQHCTQRSHIFSFYRYDILLSVELATAPLPHPLFGRKLNLLVDDYLESIYTKDVAALSLNQKLPYVRLRRKTHNLSLGDKILITGFCHQRTAKIYETPMWSKGEAFKVESDVIAVKAESKSTCPGDSGSPAFKLNEDQLEFVGLVNGVLNETDGTQITFIIPVNLEALPWKGLSASLLSDSQ